MTLSDMFKRQDGFSLPLVWIGVIIIGACIYAFGWNVLFVVIGGFIVVTGSVAIYDFLGKRDIEITREQSELDNATPSDSTPSALDVCTECGGKMTIRQNANPAMAECESCGHQVSFIHDSPPGDFFDNDDG
jgi:hypothetical protein